MRQPDNLPAFCRVHRNGRPITCISTMSARWQLAVRRLIGQFCAHEG
jgi:hypothetical protein